MLLRATCPQSLSVRKADISDIAVAVRQIEAHEAPSAPL